MNSNTLILFLSCIVFVPPTIDGLTVVNETDTLMLLCDTSQSAPVPSPSWLDPNGTEVSTVASLVIENMNRSQAGLYTCVIVQGLNELSANVTVTVQCKSLHVQCISLHVQCNCMCNVCRCMCNVTACAM